MVCSDGGSGTPNENEKILKILIHRWDPELTTIKSQDGSGKLFYFDNTIYLVNVIENFDTFIDPKFSSHSLSMVII